MLTATVSHDMRTPLNAILGIGRNLEKHIKTDLGKKYFNVIINSAKLMQSQINDIIDLFRIRNGKFTCIEERADLSVNLNEVVELFKL
jgi:signal transduction histidine kinase